MLALRQLMGKTSHLVMVKIVSVLSSKVVYPGFKFCSSQI